MSRFLLLTTLLVFAFSVPVAAQTPPKGTVKPVVKKALTGKSSTLKRHSVKAVKAKHITLKRRSVKPAVKIAPKALSYQPDIPTISVRRSPQLKGTVRREPVRKP